MEPIDADFSKCFLFPPALEEFVSAGHPARFIREFVDCVLADGEVRLTWREGNGEGRPPYSVALLLRVWLYGYLIGLTSTRKVAAACQDNVGMMWLTGLHTPDHNTLWRFWSANRKQIRQVFRQTVKIAAEAGMVSVALHAVDGTKIQSRASSRGAWDRKDLEKLLARTDQKIAEMEAAIEADGEPAEGFQIPAALQEARAMKALITQKLEVLRNEDRDRYNPVDPDAQFMKLAAGGTRLAYNAQVVVEESNSIIVAEHVVTSPSDQGQLTPMLDLVDEQLGRTADDTVADGGYNTDQALLDAHASGRAVTLAAGPSDPESNLDKPYHASRFAYDPATDAYVCPQGHTLTFDERKDKGGGRVVAIYRSAACVSCPVLNRCARSKKGRRIERNPNQALIDRNRERRRSAEGRARLKRRSAVAEPVFARIKGPARFTRFTFHGELSVAAQWTWVCTAQNLRILLARWRKEVHPPRRALLSNAVSAFVALLDRFKMIGLPV
jgi:transposase